MFPKFCCRLPRLDQHVSSDLLLPLHAPVSGGSHVPLINTTQHHPPPSTPTDIPPLPLYLHCSASFHLSLITAFFFFLYKSVSLSWFSMHSHFPSPPLCVLVHTRRRSTMLTVGWTALPSPPSCSCLNHQSHGRLNDGLGCYGVCELCTRQLCLLATSNSLHPKMNHISVLMRSAAVLALCIPLRNSLAA